MLQLPRTFPSIKSGIGYFRKPFASCRLRLKAELRPLRRMSILHVSSWRNRSIFAGVVHGIRPTESMTSIIVLDVKIQKKVDKNPPESNRSSGLMIDDGGGGGNSHPARSVWLILPTKRIKLNEFVLKIRGEKDDRKCVKSLIEMVRRARRIFSLIIFNGRFRQVGLRC